MITGSISLCIASYFINGCANQNVRNLALKKRNEEDDAMALAFVGDTEEKPLQIEEGAQYLYKICPAFHFEKCKSASSEFMKAMEDDPNSHIVFKKDRIDFSIRRVYTYFLTKTESEYQEYQQVSYNEVQKKWLFLLEISRLVVPEKLPL